MNKELFDRLEAQAAADPMTVAFPESGNEMIVRAAAEVVQKKLGRPLLIGSEQTVRAFAAELGVSCEGFRFYDNTDESVRLALAAEYTARYDDFSEKAVARKSKDGAHCAMFLVKLGYADCVAAGRVYTTADVIIAAQAVVGLQDGIDVVSSLGIVDAPGFSGSEGTLFAIADCAVNPAPDAAGLADIAIASADTVKNLLGWEPRVAMLAFSTLGSTEHESLEPVRQAIALVSARRPDIAIDGEFQLDAALLPHVAASKVKRESAVAGKANVLIFPNLMAGNIGVKLIQIFGHADAYGPVLQGFRYPVCDFSRGAPLSEIMGNIVMLLVRAQNAKRARV